MSTKRKFRMARNPLTGQMEWAPTTAGPAESLAGWLLLAGSTIVFLLVAGYFVYVYLLAAPAFDIRNLPGGGDPAMRQEVQHLRQGDQHR